MDIEYIREAIRENLRQKLYNADVSPEIDISASAPEDLLNRNYLSARKVLKSLLRNPLFKKFLSGPLRIYRSERDKMFVDSLMESLNHPNSPGESLPGITNAPLSEYAPPESPKTFREALKKTPFVGGALLWPWRLIKLPSRFHALNMEFYQIMQSVNAHDTTLAEMRSESGNFASEINEIKSRSDSNRILIDKSKNSLSQTEYKVKALEKKDDEFLRHVEGINGRLLDLQKENLDWSTFYVEQVSEEMLAENVEHHRFFIDKIAEYANIASEGGIPRLIEIGIGTATMSVYFSRGLYQVTGLDKNPDLVKKAVATNKRLGGHAKYICMDAFDLKEFFKPAGFDVSFSQGTLEHFSNRELKDILSVQLYASKYVLFSVPSENWPTRDFRDERKMSKLDWETLLRNFGFKLEFIEYYRNGLHLCCALRGQS